MFFITGTDTDIGKTIITAGIACILKQQGYKTAVYKPVQSGAQKTKDGLISPDLEFVKKISTNITLKSTYNLEAPIAPSVAAEIEKVEILPEKILKDFKSLKRDHNFVIVEGAGGILVPIYKNFLIRDLIKLLDLPLIIVSRPSLGTINHTLLTIEAAKAKNIEILGIIISNYPEHTKDIAIKTAPKVITEIGGVEILGIIPHIQNFNSDNFISVFEKNLDNQKFFTLNSH
ncbi:MAG: dethiobiotin synthase [Firmicutes bacterium]|nr:dethiobiotin synthase [Bacillota bacterium]